MKNSFRSFDFIFGTEIKFGCGSRNYLNEYIKLKNYESICIVIDHSIAKLNLFKEFLNSIEIQVKLIECDISEPTYEKLEEKRIGNKDFNIELFVGIGGGSAIDMAKGLSVLYTNHKAAIKYRGFDKFNYPITPILAIPTTAGTGSEITPNASFIDTKEKKKLGINGEAIRPTLALLDPELTISCPLSATVSAGVDSIVHATEAFVAKKSNIMAKMFAKEGFSIVMEYLPILCKDLSHIESRERVMYGAFLSAIALMNSGTGPAAAMSYPVGVHFKVPHGIGGGIFLPKVSAFNYKNGFKEYDQMVPISLGKNYLETLNETFNEIKVPRTLSDYGIKKHDLEFLATETMELSGAIEQNPVEIKESDIYKILHELT